MGAGNRPFISKERKIMLPKGLTKIAIVPANSELHAITVSRYHPICQVLDHYEPCDLAVFIGYNPGMDLLAQDFKKNGVPIVCWWIGTDILNYSQSGMFPDANIPFLYFNQKNPDTLGMLRKYAMDLMRFCDMPDKPASAKALYDFHMCPSESNKQELMASGINAIIQSVVPAAPLPLIKRLPLKRKAMFYLPIGRHEQTLDWKEITGAPEHLYMLSQCGQIIEKCPDVKFSIYGNPCKISNAPKNVEVVGVVENSKMPEFYAQHNIVFRWTAHEGIAQSVIEGKQAGLQAVTNYTLPFVHRATTIDEFVNLLNKISIEPDKKGSKYYQKQFNPINVLEKWKGFINAWKTSNLSSRVAHVHPGNQTKHNPHYEGVQESPDNRNDSVNHKQV